MVGDLVLLEAREGALEVARLDDGPGRPLRTTAAIDPEAAPISPGVPGRCSG
jgi:hypothetical protein